MTAGRKDLVVELTTDLKSELAEAKEKYYRFTEENEMICDLISRGINSWRADSDDNQQGC